MTTPVRIDIDVYRRESDLTTTLRGIVYTPGEVPRAVATTYDAGYFSSREVGLFVESFAHRLANELIPAIARAVAESETVDAPPVVQARTPATLTVAHYRAMMESLQYHGDTIRTSRFSDIEYVPYKKPVNPELTLL